MVQDQLPDSHELQRQVYAAQDELYGFRFRLLDQQ